MPELFDDEYIALMREHPLERLGKKLHGHEVAEPGDFAILEFGDEGIYLQTGGSWEAVGRKGFSGGPFLSADDLWLPRGDQLIDRLVAVGWGDVIELSHRKGKWLARGVNHARALTPEVEFYGHGGSRLAALRRLLLEIEAAATAEATGA